MTDHQAKTVWLRSRFQPMVESFLDYVRDTSPFNLVLACPDKLIVVFHDWCAIHEIWPGKIHILDTFDVVTQVQTRTIHNGNDKYFVGEMRM
jgi:hypothetical protein